MTHMHQVHRESLVLKKINKGELSLLLQLHQYNNPEHMLSENSELLDSASIDIYGLFYDSAIIGELRVKYRDQDPAIAFPGRRVYLYALRILDNYRNLGLGTYILNSAISMLENDGYREFTIGVEDKNTIARKLYGKFSFVHRIKRVYEIYQGDTYEYDLLLRQQ